MTRNSNISSKDWMDLARYSKLYIGGVEPFLDFACSYGDPQGEESQCPCAKCCNICWTRRNVVYDHLICYGFVKGYTRWINHGEWDIKLNVDDDMDYSHDDIDGLLNDQFRDVAQAEGTVPRDLFNMSDEFESDLPQSYENELSEHLMGPSIPEDDREVPLVRTDVPETVIDVPSKEFVTQQLEVEYEKEFEDESEEEFEDESKEECEDGFENEYEDDSKDESEDDTP
uniref:Transposon protein, CACTA, En/Spm sub-class n=1 Tax=Solanum tuberosum TaxID=4113 RepID=M1E014_SOLTU